MTGQEPVPVLFGGQASLIEAGAVFGEPALARVERISFVLACLARFPFYLWFAALGMTIFSTVRGRTIVLSGIVTLLVLGPALSVSTLHEAPAFFRVERAVTLGSGETVRYRVNLSHELVAALAQRFAQNDPCQLCVFCQSTQPVQLNVFASDNPLELREGHLFHWIVARPETAIAYISQHRELTFIIHNRSQQEVFVAGWQKNPRPGREMTVAGQADASPHVGHALPVVEIRIFGQDTFLELAAF
jgi:hypothetical protein